MAENQAAEVDDFDSDDTPLPDDVEIIVDENDDGEPEEADDGAGEEIQPVDEAAEPLEAEPEEVAPVEEDDDPELKALPEKVSTMIRKRIDRERRKMDSVVQEREVIRQAALQVAEVARRNESEVVLLKQQNAALQRQFAETLDYAYERDIGLAAQELRKAREDGDYDKELQAQSRMDTLRFQQNQVRQAKTSLPDPERIAASARQAEVTPTQAQPQAQQPRRTPPPPLAVQWLQRNQTWFNNAKYSGHRAFALQEDTNLVAEGYDKNSVEYYQELDRRIDSAFPALRKKKTGNTSPVAPATTAPARNTSSKTIKLTRADLHNMRNFGLDPNNKEHLREYAKSKRAA